MTTFQARLLKGKARWVSSFLSKMGAGDKMDIEVKIMIIIIVHVAKKFFCC
jgi:hypothetical protein